EQQLFDGTLDFSSLWDEEGQNDESVRADGDESLAAERAGTVRGDRGSGDVLHGSGRSSGGADLPAADADRGAGSERRGVPGEGGPAERGTEPGGGSGADRPGVDLAGDVDGRGL